MRDQKTNDKRLTAYLLGTLTEDEAEHLDELTFTDPDFAQVLDEAENELVDAYSNGELSGTELEKFETHYLASPRRREKVQFAEAFQEFAEQRSTAEYGLKIAEKEPQAKGSFSGLFGFGTLQWGFAAAGLIFAVLGIWLVLENLALKRQVNDFARTTNGAIQQQDQVQQQIESEQKSVNIDQHQPDHSQGQSEWPIQNPENTNAQDHNQTRPSNQNSRLGSTSSPSNISVATFVLLPQMRGSENMQPISIPSGASQVLFRLRLETSDFKQFKAVLRDQSTNQVMWQSRTVSAKQNAGQSTLDLRIPARLLHGDLYAISVSGISSSGPPENLSDYSFRIMQ